jgi:hypothetical protein
MIHANEIVDSADVLHVSTITQGTIWYSAHTFIDHFIRLQPAIPAALTPNDSAACNVRPAFPANRDEGRSITDTDLQRHRTVVALEIAMTESTNKATHRTYPSLSFASIFMKSFE